MLDFLLLAIYFQTLMYFPAASALLEKRPFDISEAVGLESTIVTSSSTSLSPLSVFTPAAIAPTSYLAMRESPSAKASSFEAIPPYYRNTSWDFPKSTTLHSLQPVGTSISANLSVIDAPTPSITTPPADAQKLSAPQSDVASGCTPFPCSIIFQFVGVYYFFESGMDTACLGTTKYSPQMALSGISLPQSPDQLVLFTSIRATDGCQQIGTTFVDYTHTFRSGELSSSRDGATYSFNVQDLPCPPPSVNWSGPGLYAPTIAFPPWMTDLDPAWSDCRAGYKQGIDPYTAFPSAPVAGPGEGPPIRRSKRTELGHGHAHHPARKIPRAVAATTTSAVKP